MVEQHVHALATLVPHRWTWVLGWPLLVCQNEVDIMRAIPLVEEGDAADTVGMEYGDVAKRWARPRRLSELCEESLTGPLDDDVPWEMPPPALSGLLVYLGTAAEERTDTRGEGEGEEERC